MQLLTARIKSSKNYFLTSGVVQNVFLCICAYFQTTRIKSLKNYFLTSGVVQNVFDILACISDSYLRLTTAHTQAKKKQLLQQYTPAPPKGGDRFDLCVFIGYKYWVRLHSDIPYSFITQRHSHSIFIHYMSEQLRLFSCGMCINNLRMTFV